MQRSRRADQLRQRHDGLAALVKNELHKGSKFNPADGTAIDVNI